MSAFNDSTNGVGDRFKLFNDSKLCEVVFGRLIAQLQKHESIAPNPKISLCLVAGKIASVQDREALKKYFCKKGWMLWCEDDLRKSLTSIANGSYQNDVADVVAKLLIRPIK
jgi:hypothetical protein